MESEITITQFQALPGMGAVDFDAGSISGVSVMSIGPALGHGITIDQEGLQQCLLACQSRGKVRLIDKHDGEFEDIVGYVHNFRISEGKVIGDAQLFENHPRRRYVLEVADQIPTEFGLSIESDSNHIENPTGEGKLFRCSMVDAIALVPRPAANLTGLFSARKVDTRTKTNPNKMDKLKFSAKLKAAFTKLAEGEDSPEVEAIVSAVSEAVEEVVAEAVTEAVTQAGTATDEKLAKLEEPEMSEEDKKKAEEAAKLEEQKEEERMTALAEKAAEKKVTQFTAELGIKRAPGSAGGFVVPDDKTKLAAEISAQKAAGAKSDGDALFKLARNKPELYNEFRAKGLI
jgi:hypothetical protein